VVAANDDALYFEFIRRLFDVNCPVEHRKNSAVSTVKVAQPLARKKRFFRCFPGLQNRFFRSHLRRVESRRKDEIMLRKFVRNSE
jgi:hypothetical protein